MTKLNWCGEMGCKRHLQVSEGLSHGRGGGCNLHLLQRTVSNEGIYEKNKGGGILNFT